MKTVKTIPDSSLQVSWAMNVPSMEAKTWHLWTDGIEDPSLHKTLEQNLQWPLGTIGVLERAFELHLSRSVGWQLDGINHSAAYHQAAAIFRRGVPHSQQKVRSFEGSYPIAFKASDISSELFKRQGLCIVDQRVASAWDLPLRPQDLAIALDETHKSLEAMANIKSWIEAHDGPVAIIGGGILADTAAFAAALLNRDFTLYPTTLLAMIDACVGGKTGVNFGRFGKNQLGLFAFPKEVVIATSWLKTLPEREFRAGLAEGYKHALIDGDKALAAALAQLPQDVEAVLPYLAKMVSVKVRIIEEDPSETGKRAILNFGHTLAHALEKVSQDHSPEDSILHGEAIGIGMLFALFVSHALDYLPEPSYREIQNQLRSSNFLIHPNAFQKYLGLRGMADGSLINELSSAVLQDKKNLGDGSSEWILLEDWGRFALTGSQFTVAVTADRFKALCKDFLLKEGWIDPIYQSKI